MDLIITDLVAESGYDSVVSVNGTTPTIFHAWSGGNGYHSFASGYKADAGSSVVCSRNFVYFRLLCTPIISQPFLAEVYKAYAKHISYRSSANLGSCTAAL